MRRLAVLLSTFGLAACSDDSPEQPNPTDTSSDIQDIGTDTTAPSDDTTAPPEDTGPGEGDTDTAPSDTDTNADTDTDTGTDPGSTFPQPGDTVEASRGQSCEAHRRIGTIEFSSWDPQGPVYLSGAVYDRLNPAIGEPTLSTEVCAFYESLQAFCATPCNSDEICVQPGTCVAQPKPRQDVKVTFERGESSTTFEPQAPYFWVDGEVPGFPTSHTDTGEVTVQVGDITIKAVVTQPYIPLDITVAGKGSSDRPEGITISWNQPFASSYIATTIGANHHANSQTFTHCQSPVQSFGVIEIPGTMLQPLATHTGLEFQTIDIIEYSKVELAEGCLEIRTLQRHFSFLEFQP